MAATARLSAAPARRPAGLLVPRLVAGVVILGGWQALALSGLLFRDVVPPLQTVAAGLAGVVVDPAFYANLAVTGGELLAAIVIGGLSGLVVGLALGASPFLSRAFERWLQYLGPTPKIILFPVLIMLFGVGGGSKVAMGAISAFFPIAISIAAGVRAVNPTWLRVARSFRAGLIPTVLKVYLPAMAPTLINGFRLGFGIAIIGVLLAETKLSNQGIGFMIINAYTRFDMPRMYALLILTVVFAAGINLLAARAADRLGGRR
jgi:ABC-type nitrate/sulfonate/bicarbonate transport system permease component